MIEYTDRYFRGLDLRTLRVDEAFINATKATKQDYFLYFLSEECNKCPYTNLQNITGNKNHIFKVDVSRNVYWKIYDTYIGRYDHESQAEPICQLQPQLGEFGVYDLQIHDNNVCSITTAKDPVNIYLSILTVLLIALGATFLGYFTKCVVKKYSRTESNEQQNDGKEKPTKKRLKSLDTFRGIAIILMIFVNSGGGHYWWIEHATWNGLQIADLVFPWFLFIMGVCIPMSIKSQINRSVKKKDIIYNILKRSIKLFFIGLCLNTVNGANFETIRIFGVLQRFGIAYFVVSSIHVMFAQSPVMVQAQNVILRQLFDVVVLVKDWAIMLIILTVYLCLIFLYYVPGCGRGYFGPGGKNEFLKYQNCTGGFVGYIDKLILTNNHIYQHPTAKYVYDGHAFDPEGVFGCLPTIFHVFLGLQCGMILVVYTDCKARVIRWLSWGIILGLLAGILCGFSKNDGIIPLNKNLWSLSYVFATSSLAFILLTVCYVLIDVKGIWNAEPFFYPGMNAIIMYVGHTIFHKMLPWHWSIGMMNTHFMLLLECIWNTVLWNLIAFYLFTKNFFYSL